MLPRVAVPHLPCRCMNSEYQWNNVYELKGKGARAVALLSLCARASVVYVLYRVVLWGVLLFERDASVVLSYHPADSNTWYCLWFFVPIVLSLVLGKYLRSPLLRNVGAILLPLVVSITIAGGILNTELWGYTFRRPVVCSEIREATRLHSIVDVARASGELQFTVVRSTVLPSVLPTYHDWYYGHLERPLVVLHERIGLRSLSTRTALSDTALQTIARVVLGSELLVVPARGYEKRGAGYEGRIIECSTGDNTYYHVSMRSGEVENDHYAAYEFLLDALDNCRIVKKQRYFVDIAGIEGVEYGNLAPLLEFFALLGSIGVGLLWSVWQKWYGRERKKVCRVVRLLCCIVSGKVAIVISS